MRLAENEISSLFHASNLERREATKSGFSAYVASFWHACHPPNRNSLEVFDVSAYCSCTLSSRKRNLEEKYCNEALSNIA